jgi:hypothetical protein
MNAAGFDRSIDIVEDALRTLPLRPVPGRLQPRVMRRVRSLPAAPRFAFPWLEGAISLMLSTLLTGTSYLLLSIPPGALIRLIQSVRLFFILPANRPILFAMATGTGMLMLCFASAVRIFLPLRRGSHPLRFRWHRS